MRVGFGVTAWSKGLDANHLDGIGVYTQNLWAALSQQGCELHGLCFGCSGTSADALKGVYEFVEHGFAGQLLKAAVLGAPFSGTSCFEAGVEVYHATDHHIPLLRDTPVVATVMDAIPLVHPDWASSRLRWLKNHVFKKSAQWCDEVITISEFSKQDIAEHFAVPEERISVTPLGVNPDFFNVKAVAEVQSVLARHGIGQGAFIFVGTLQPRKNVRRIIEAHRRLPTSVRAEHRLVIIGRYGWGDKTLVDDLLKLQAENAGYWLNDVNNDDLLALLQSAVALVYPSLYEGFGLPVLEGFASGIPVISSCTTSVPEVAGDAALLVNPLSVDDIAEAMLQVVEDRELAADLTRRGLARAREFTWARCAQQTLNVYRKAVR